MVSLENELSESDEVWPHRHGEAAGVGSDRDEALALSGITDHDGSGDTFRVALVNEPYHVEAAREPV